MEREFSPAQHLQQLNYRIDFRSYALSLGYHEQRSSILEVELKHPTHGDNIVATRNSGEPWHYRSVHDANDRGTLVDFVRTREGKGSDATLAHLRQWEDDRRQERPPFDINAAHRRSEAIRTENQRFLESKGITRETLTASVFQQNLRQSPTRDDMWHAAPRSPVPLQLDDEQYRPERLVIAQNTVTALSHYQLHRPERTAYAALSGRPNPNQGAALESAMRDLDRRGIVVVAASNDVSGRHFSDQVRQVFERTANSWQELEFKQHAPTLGRTWNDQLQMSRVNGISMASSSPSPQARSPGIRDIEHSPTTQARTNHGLHR